MFRGEQKTYDSFPAISQIHQRSLRFSTYLLDQEFFEFESFLFLQTIHKFPFFYS